LPGAGLAIALAPPYLRTLMAVLPPMSRPSVALRDLMAFLRQRSRDQVIPACLAVLVTAIIVIVFLVDSKINTAPPPQIIYVENYAANRTDADIIADQKKDQAAREAAAKEKQRQFQQLEKRLGMD
jgi:hypothetical protein